MTASEAIIIRVSRVDACYEAHEWEWAAANRDAITQNWERRKAKTPRIFNGRVLLLRDITIKPDHCCSVYFEVDYAQLLTWIDLGYPDKTIANGFAMGALQGSDGAFICGVMSDHTANAGRVYFPAGTPDRADMRPNGEVDLATSLTRELVEETGLAESQFTVAEDWIVVQQWPIVAMMRSVSLAVPAEEGARRIMAALESQAEPELKGVKIVRSPADIDPGTMPIYLQSFLRWSFAQR